MRPTQGLSSIADIKEALHMSAQKTVPGTWIRGRGYNEFHLAEKRHPNRWDLDEVVPNHPVKLTHRSDHAHVLHSLALQPVNISNERLLTLRETERYLHIFERTVVCHGCSDHTQAMEST
jgi:predicted amidohydrolase YtcJ